MAEIRPFRGYRYNQSKVNIQDVIAPPYDVISTNQQSMLYDSSPHNVVRLILGREEDRYSSAARNFLSWQDGGILVRDARPSMYLLHQTFELDGGIATTRKGFIALCRLEEFDRKIVLPHEKTLSKPKEDRLKLFKACDANFSQIFSLYSDPQKITDDALRGTTATHPEIDVTFEDVRNKLWRIENGETISVVQKFLADKQVLIADGHHRYETALTYREFKRSQNPKHTGNELYNYVMMFFTNLDDEGLVILPTHRVVHSLPSFDQAGLLARLSDFFICRDFREPHALLAALEASSGRAFGMFIKDDPLFYLLTLRPALNSIAVIREDAPVEVKELDVTLLHTLILRDILGISPAAQEQKTNLDYVKTVDDALNSVWKGNAQLAFLMNATKIQEVRRVARAGHTMPQKSTYFYPKLLSGLVINKLAE